MLLTGVWGAPEAGGGDMATPSQPLPMGKVLCDLSSLSCPKLGGLAFQLLYAKKEKNIFYKV